MKFFKDLYLDEKTLKKKNKIISRIEKKKLQPMIYVIYIPENSDSQLEIIHSSLLLQKTFSAEPALIVGLTSGFDAALDIVEKITCEVFRNTGTANIKSYLQNREQGERNVKHSSFDS